jgi:hypothetical protein
MNLMAILQLQKNLLRKANNNNNKKVNKMTDITEENDPIVVTAETKEGIFKTLVEITHELSKQDESKNIAKGLAQKAQEDYGIKTKYINKMAKVMYSKTFQNVQDEAAHFESLYEVIVGERGDEFAKE